MAKVSNLINNGIKIQMPDMIKVHRIGKYNTNRRVRRPLRLVFQDKFERNKVARNARNLKEADNNRNEIDAHLLENHEKLNTQAGFTTGSMIEDNLFTMQYCIERNFKLRRPLIVTCLDYSKAFDSIKREN